jgi:hypothetical protein
MGPQDRTGRSREREKNVVSTGTRTLSLPPSSPQAVAMPTELLRLPYERGHYKYFICSNNRGVLLSTLLHAILHPSHHLLNVLLQIANKLGSLTKRNV